MGNAVTKLSKLCVSVGENLKLATLAIGPNMKSRCQLKLASIKENSLRRKRNVHEAISGYKTFIYNEASSVKASAIEFALEQRQNASLIASTGVEATVDKISSIQSSTRHKVQSMKSWISDNSQVLRDYSTNQISVVRDEVAGHIKRVFQSVSSLVMLIYAVILSFVRQSRTYYTEHKQNFQAAFSIVKDKVLVEVCKVVAAKRTAKQKLYCAFVTIIFISLLTFTSMLFCDVYYGESASAYAKIEATGKVIGSCIEWIWNLLWSCVVVTLLLACTLFGQLYIALCFLLHAFYCGTCYATRFNIRISVTAIVWTSRYMFHAVNVTVNGSSIAIKHTVLTFAWAGSAVIYWLNVVYVYASGVGSVILSCVQDQVRFIVSACMEGTQLALFVMKHLLCLLLQQIAVVLQITANSTLIALEVTTRLLAVTFNATVRLALKAAMYTLENGTVALSEGLDLLQDGIVYCVLNAGDLSYLASIYAKDLFVVIAEASMLALDNLEDLLVAVSYASVNLAQKAASMLLIILNSLMDIFRWATLLAAKWTVKGFILSVLWVVWNAFYGTIWLIYTLHASVTWMYCAVVYFMTNTREATASFLQWLLAFMKVSLHTIGIAVQFLYEQFCIACLEVFSSIAYVFDLLLTGMRLSWTGFLTASSFTAEKLYILIKSVCNVTYDYVTRGSTAAVQQLTTSVQVTSSSLQYSLAAFFCTFSTASKAMYLSTMTAASVSVKCVWYGGVLVWSTSSTLTHFLFGIASGVTNCVSLTLNLVLNKFMLGGTVYVLHQSVSIILLLVQVIGQFVVNLFVYISSFIASVVSHIYRVVSIFALFFYQIAMTVSLVIRAFIAVVRHVLTLIFGLIMFVLNQILGMYLYVMDVYHTYQEIIFLLTIATVFIYCISLIRDRSSKGGSDEYEEESGDSLLFLTGEEPPLYQDIAAMPAYDDDSGSDAEFQLDSLASDYPDIDL